MNFHKDANTPSAIIVTGMSGAGRRTALNALEDCGFRCVDNLPTDLIPHVISNNPASRRLALGMGSRRTVNDYDLFSKFQEAADPDLNFELLFLDADAATIARRYDETRRVHPLAGGHEINKAIDIERGMLENLRRSANYYVDTSALSPHDLRAELKRQFNLADAQQFLITVESFSYKFGTPPSADYLFDCRFLNNPHWNPELKEKTGESLDVQNFVKADGNFQRFHDDIHNMLSYMLPTYQAEGRSYVSIAFGCTGGKHRSVTMAITLSKELRDNGYQVKLTHRELEKS